MRAAPAVTVTIPRSTWWVRCLGLLAVAALAVSLAWALSPSGSVLRWAAVAVTAAWVGWTFASALRTPVVRLQWDRQIWRLQTMGTSAAGEPAEGSIAVMLDLGNWMLLRFHPSDKRLRSSWIPAELAGLERDWHALRCAVYSPRPSRPVEAGASASDSVPPPA